MYSSLTDDHKYPYTQGCRFAQEKRCFTVNNEAILEQVFNAQVLNDFATKCWNFTVLSISYVNY